MDKLPPEIWCQVLSTLTLDYYGFDPGSFRELRVAEQADSARKLMLVCRRWRSMIEQTPQLWFAFCFTEGKPYNLQSHLWRTRSGTLPLHLCIMVVSLEGLRTLWLDAVKPVLPRLGTLAIIHDNDQDRIHASPIESQEYWSDLMRSECLSHLTFWGVSLPLPDVYLQNSRVPTLLGLRTLMSSCCTIPTIVAPSLEQLYMMSTNYDSHTYQNARQMWETISSTKVLNQVVLYHASFDESDFIDSQNDVTFTQLENLELAVSCYPDIRVHQALLSRCTRLKSLILDIPIDNQVSLFSMPVNAFPFLVYLCLDVVMHERVLQVYEQVKGIIDCLEHASSLEKLTVSTWHFMGAELFMHVLLLHAGGTRVFLPNLNHLEILRTTLYLPSLLQRIAFERSALLKTSGSHDEKSIQKGISTEQCSNRHVDRQCFRISTSKVAISSKVIRGQDKAHWDEERHHHMLNDERRRYMRDRFEVVNAELEDYQTILADFIDRTDEKGFNIEHFAAISDPKERLRLLCIHFGFPVS